MKPETSKSATITTMSAQAIESQRNSHEESIVSAGFQESDWDFIPICGAFVSSEGPVDRI
jgi:hypothetical protein